MAKDWALLGAVLGLLVLASLFGYWLSRQERLGLDKSTVDSFNRRVQAWWFFSIVLGLAFFKPTLTVVLFGLLSFWAMREFITLTSTSPGDHRALFWTFFFFTPMQFVLVAFNFYTLFSILIPIGAFFFITTRSAISGDFDHYLERMARIEFGLLVCVYSLSFAPALLFLDYPERAGDFTPARLLFFFITLVLFAELMQFFCSRLFGKHPISVNVDPTRTWEGLLGSTVVTSLAGLSLYWATPFSAWWQALAMSAVITVMASAGALTIAAIQKDRGEVTSGTLIEGHGGVLTRIDSICFAAPVFYHLTRYFFAVPS
jgi:phosphatidate cytidylyltransferase